MTNANPTVSAAFNPLSSGECSLTVIPNGSGKITFSPQSDRYRIGQLVTVAAVPDPRQEFIGWTDDASGMENPMVMALDRSKVVTAHFSKRPRLTAGPCDGQSSGSGFRLTLRGELGAYYQLDGSSHLPSWTPLARMINSLGVSQFSDHVNVNPASHFYRALFTVKSYFDPDYAGAVQNGTPSHPWTSVDSIGWAAINPNLDTGTDVKLYFSALKRDVLTQEMVTNLSNYTHTTAPPH